MTDRHNETAAELWTRTNEISGDFTKNYSSLQTTFDEFGRGLVHSEIGGDKVLQTEVLSTLRNGAHPELYGNVSRVFAYKRLGVFEPYKEPDQNFYLFLEQGSGLKSRFQLTPDGFLTDMDEPDGASLECLNNSGLNKREVDNLCALIRRYTSDKSSERQLEDNRRSKKRRAIATTVIAATAVASATYAGLNYWVFEPHHRAEVARHDYDAAKHNLQGTEFIVNGQKVKVLDKAEFNKIPDYKDGDSLASPRTIEVQGNDCVNIDNVDSAGQQLAVALPEGDPLVGSDVSAANTDSNTLQICLYGQDSPQDWLEEPHKSQLAVQLRPAQ